MRQPKPLYLLADSALLFQKDANGIPALHSILNHLDHPNPLAVYVGASNGDLPEFYEIFQAGMQNLGIHRCAHVRAEFTNSDRDALEAADLILLAGGDPLLGWTAMKTTGMLDLIKQKYETGCVLLGTSAGAIHLSDAYFDTTSQKYLPMLQLAPYVIDVHDEKNDWQAFKSALTYSEKEQVAIGIPSGVGVKYEVGKPLVEIGGFCVFMQ